MITREKLAANWANALCSRDVALEAPLAASWIGVADEDSSFRQVARLTDLLLILEKKRALLKKARN
jgi:hypothetical protein